MPQIDSNGISLNYTDSGGDGRPVVLIHGWPLSGASWSEQVPALVEAGHRVITYDRRGFGDSDKPENGYDYDTFAADLAGLLDGLDLRDVTLVGFSMGGGEVARYIGSHGEDRIHSAVFAGAVPPYLLKTDDNPDGGLGEDDVNGMQQGASADREGFLDEFTTGFFSAGDELKVTEEQRQDALALTRAGPGGGPPRLHRLPSGAPTSATTSRGSPCPRSSSMATPTRSCPSRSPASAPPPPSRAARSWSSRVDRTGSTSATPTSSTAPCSSSWADDTRRLGPRLARVSALAGLVDKGLVAPDWAEALAPVDGQIAAMGQFLRAEIAAGRHYLPAGEQVLRAFSRPLADVKVLIVGQDPYPTPGHPVGLSFSVAPGVAPPKSLVNIFKELVDDLGVPPPDQRGPHPVGRRRGDAAEQVPHRRPPASRPRTEVVAGRRSRTRRSAPSAARSKEGAPLTAILWGRDAQSLKPELMPIPWVESVHPSPLSAHRGFFGSKPFSRVNRMLEEQGGTPVDWRLP